MIVTASERAYQRNSFASSNESRELVKSEPVTMSLVQPTSLALPMTSLRSSGCRWTPRCLPLYIGSARLIPIFTGHASVTRVSGSGDQIRKTKHLHRYIWAYKALIPAPGWAAGHSLWKIPRHERWLQCNDVAEDGGPSLQSLTYIQNLDIYCMTQ